MLFKSSRGGEGGLSFEKVLLSAYAQDGGLYVPEHVPKIDRNTLLSWQDFSFAEVLANIELLQKRSPV
jgi:threonine synthase